ncbi:MAG TPA: BamA/TamA family outer membrane protein [Candidatus Obscuribacterales bacterium]
MKRSKKPLIPNLIRRLNPVLIPSLFLGSLLVPGAAWSAPATAPAPEATSAPDVAPTNDTIRFEHQDPLLPALVKIRRITVIGTQYEDSVRLIMQIQAGDEVSPEAIEKDRQRILGLGYFADVTPKLIALSDGHELVIYLRELSQLKSVEMGNEPKLVPVAQILEPFEALRDQVLNMRDLQAARDRVEGLYHRQGYLLAHLELEESEGRLKLLMHEGLIESIELEGLERTEPGVIRRELRQQPGEAFNQQIMSEDLARLRNLGHFESVSLRPEQGKSDSHRFRIVVVVKEKQSRDIGLNFSLNNRDGLLGGMHYTDTNFLGKSEYLNLQFQAGLDLLNLFNGQAGQSQRSFYGRVDFSDPWLLPGRTAFGASLFSERTPLFFGSALNGLPGLDNGLLQTRTGVNLSLGRPLFGDSFSPWRGNLAFGAEQVALTDFSRLPRRELSLSKRFSATDVFFNATGTLSYDTRDMLINPSSGVFGSFSAQPVWGDGSYLRLIGNLNTYIPLIPEALTLALGVQGGAYLGQQPLYEQFFGAGYSTIRGWQENGSLFGSEYLIGSAEARFPIWNPVSGVLFTDIGNFFPDSWIEQNQGLPFKYGVGAGIRVETPLGMLRLDYGVRNFSQLGWNSLLEAGQLHFSIGQKF